MGEGEVVGKEEDVIRRTRSKARRAQEFENCLRSGKVER
jgi:hypothetical protein